MIHPQLEFTLSHGGEPRESLRNAAERARLGTVPIIIVSALSSQMTRLAGLEAGAVAFVTKPFAFRDLMASVNRVLGVKAGEAAAKTA